MLISDNFVDHGKTLMMMMMMTTEDKDRDNYDGDSDDNKSILHWNNDDMILSLPLDLSVCQCYVHCVCTLSFYWSVLLSQFSIQGTFFSSSSSSFFKPRISIPEVWHSGPGSSRCSNKSQWTEDGCQCQECRQQVDGIHYPAKNPQENRYVILCFWLKNLIWSPWWEYV